MKRLAVLLALAATLLMAGPVSANHEIYKAYFGQPGIHGTVSMTYDADHSLGTVKWTLDNMKDGYATIDINQGKCGDFSGHVFRVYTVDNRNFVNGDWTGDLVVPKSSQVAFKHAWWNHDGVSATIRNEGRTTCESFHKSHP